MWMVFISSSKKKGCCMSTDMIGAAISYEKDMFNLAFHFLKNTHDAEDCVQSSYEKILCKIGTLNDPLALKSWVKRIVVNTAFDMLKKRDGQLLKCCTSDRYILARCTDEHITHEVICNKEMGEFILAGLKLLPEKHRMVFEMSEIEGISHKEISENMKCNLGTVMSRNFNAKIKMRNSLVSMGISH